MRRISVLRAALLVAVAWAAGERADGQVTGREAPAKVVQFSLVAMDNHGQPVGDLKAEEFQITDAGKAQKLALFRHSDSKLQQVPPLAPGEFSNRGAANVPRATVILFDLLNQSFEARGFAANALTQALKSLESSDCLYLYLLTADMKLYPVYPLPSGGTATPTAGGIPWTRDAKPLVDGAVGKVNQLRSTGLDIDTRIRATYRTLGNVASLMAGVPGRKNIVWITHGIPITLPPSMTISNEPVDYTPMLRRLSQGLDRVNVAIYPVMQIPPGMSPDGPEAAGLGSQDTLQQFSDLTGGPARSTDSIGTVVRQAMNDVRTSYQLGYTPPSENWDGKFHKLHVTCSRKGVKVQAKTGYYAVADVSNDEQDALDAAAAGSFDASEIGLRGSASATPKGPTVRHFALRIEPADVRITQEGDRYTGSLAVQLAAYAASGDEERSSVAPVNLKLSAEELATVKRDGIPWSQDINIGDKVVKVRFLVFDRESRAVGSLTVPVK